MATITDITSLTDAIRARLAAGANYDAWPWPNAT
jgi:hypothetical protein